MIIDVSVKKSGFGTPGIAKQVAFATYLTMNRTLDEGQLQQRAGIHQRFIVRNPRFIDNMVKRQRDDFATPQRLVARLRIIGPEGSEDRAQILTRHETGGERTTGKGGYSQDPVYHTAGYFYLPTRIIRGTPTAVIPRADYPTNLRLVPRHAIEGGMMAARSRTTRKGVIQLQGKRRTFVLFEPGDGAPIGIFQRHDGRKGKSERDDIVMIWNYRRSITLKPRLQFFATQQANFDERYDVNFRGFMSYAVRTAK